MLKALLLFALSLLSTTLISEEYRRVVERINSLDPIEATSVPASRCTALIYETLLEYDYESRPYTLKPLVATSLPHVSPCGLIWTININTNLYFTPDPCFGINPDGSPGRRHITSQDVIYSLKRLADAKNASGGYWTIEDKIKGVEDFHNASKAAMPTDYNRIIEGLDAPAPDRLTITLNAPSPIFKWLLAMPYMSIVPKEAVEYYKDKFKEHPVGTGPYRLATWKRNYAITYTQNTNWPGWNSPKIREDKAKGLYPFEKLFFPTIDDPSTQWLAFLAGELDLMGEVSRDNWEEVLIGGKKLNPKFEKMGIRMARMETLEVAYIGINMDDPVLGKNKKLRQALNAAFNAQRWEDYYQGRMDSAVSPLPKSVEGIDLTPFPFERSEQYAKKLLEEAGYIGGIDKTTGKRLSLTIDVGKTTTEMRESTELLISFFEKCGIELKAEYHNWPTFLKKVSNRQSQLFRVAWVGDYPDGENFLQLFYGKSASPGPNRSNYNNKEFDRIFEEALTSNDHDRIEAYKHLQQIVKDDCPWIFISYPSALSLIGPRLHSYIPHDFPYGMEKHLRYRKKQKN